MNYKGVIFDLDGTLANTLADIAGSMNRVLHKHGFPTHRIQDYKYLIGRGLENLVSSSLPSEHRQDSLVADCLTAMADDYRHNCLVKTRLYDGIEALLGNLLAKGIKMGIFSNKADELTQIIVRSLLPSFPFQKIIGARPDIAKKPDPAGALLISREMGIEPENIIYMGDSDVDMITATKAGMLAVGVLWGFRTGAELKENGASVLLKSPGELLTWTGIEFRNQK
jgi:phosphoglycolate phosphatase